MDKKSKLPNWVYWVWLISIVSLGLSITSVFWGYNIKWNVEVVSTAIILGFVGILATFVVVGNYSQVKDIENKFERLVSIQTNNFNNKITEIYKERELFEYQKNDLLSLMYLEIAKIYYYNQQQEKDQKCRNNAAFRYKRSVLSAISFAGKTETESMLEMIEQFLSGNQIAYPGFNEANKMQFNKIIQQIDIDKIRKIGTLKKIEQLIFQ